MPANDGDILDFGVDVASSEFDDASPLDLDTIRLLAINESIRDVVVPILDDMLISVLSEIADVEFFIATSPYGLLEETVADATGLTDEIDAMWESL